MITRAAEQRVNVLNRYEIFHFPFHLAIQQS